MQQPATLRSWRASCCGSSPLPSPPRRSSPRPPPCSIGPGSISSGSCASCSCRAGFTRRIASGSGSAARPSTSSARSARSASAGQLPSSPIHGRDGPGLAGPTERQGMGRRTGNGSIRPPGPRESTAPATCALLATTAARPPTLRSPQGVPEKIKDPVRGDRPARQGPVPGRIGRRDSPRAGRIPLTTPEAQSRRNSSVTTRPPEAKDPGCARPDLQFAGIPRLLKPRRSTPMLRRREFLGRGAAGLSYRRRSAGRCRVCSPGRPTSPAGRRERSRAGRHRVRRGQRRAKHGDSV